MSVLTLVGLKFEDPPRQFTEQCRRFGFIPFAEFQSGSSGHIVEWVHDTLRSIGQDCVWLLAVSKGDIDLDRVYEVSRSIANGCADRVIESLSASLDCILFLDLAAPEIDYREFSSMHEMMSFLREELEYGSAAQSLCCVVRP